MTDKGRNYIREEATKILQHLPDEAKKLIAVYIEDMAEERFQSKTAYAARISGVMSWVEPLSVLLIFATVAGSLVFCVKGCHATEKEIAAEVNARCDAALQEIEELKKDDTRASARKLEFCQPQR